jgi:23S rRNA (pseudouridine1915-N3)-methyltransferase
VRLRVAWIGKTKDPAIQGLTDEYLKRLSRYVDSEGFSVKDESSLLKLAGRDNSGSGGSRIPKSSLVLLDSRGKQLSSEELADYLRDYQDRQSVPVIFAIGAADGFSPAARNAASMILSLGKMTIAHELARVVLLEQLYRAFTIIKGHPYHTGH